MIRIPALIILTLTCLFGCELPQHKSSDTTSTSETAGEVEVGNHEWFYLSITDETAVADSDGMPGVEIDTIAVSRDGGFLFAGCKKVELYGASSAHAENVFVNTTKATLGVREGSKEAGFVSLAGGTLVCELPVMLKSGDELTIWEVDGDADDSYSLTFATTPTGKDSTTIGPYEASITLTVP